MAGKFAFCSIMFPLFICENFHKVSRLTGHVRRGRAPTAEIDAEGDMRSVTVTLVFFFFTFPLHLQRLMALPATTTYIHPTEGGQQICVRPYSMFLIWPRIENLITPTLVALYFPRVRLVQCCPLVSHVRDLFSTPKLLEP
jgi:hypothetical protein